MLCSLLVQCVVWGQNQDQIWPERHVQTLSVFVQECVLGLCVIIIHVHSFAVSIDVVPVIQPVLSPAASSVQPSHLKLGLIIKLSSRLGCP